MKLVKLVVPKKKTLDQIVRNRHKILIIRSKGGLGDLTMCRMLFSEFKSLYPGCHLTFACPLQYFQAVDDHPFLDAVVDAKTVNPDDYGINFDISSGCIRYEIKNAPFSYEHRSDIWAEVCGIKLTSHDCHFRVRDDGRVDEKLKILNPDGKPVLLVSPVTAMDNKNIYPEQLNPILPYLKDFCVLISHDREVDGYDAPFYVSGDIKELICLISKVDYVLAGDTAVFHIAGGLDKKVVGVFGWADGDVYSKYHKHAIIVQKHRKNGDWACGPCYDFSMCNQCDPKVRRKPCITGITPTMILEAVQKMIGRQ